MKLKITWYVRKQVVFWNFYFKWKRFYRKKCWTRNDWRLRAHPHQNTVIQKKKKIGSSYFKYIERYLYTVFVRISINLQQNCIVFSNSLSAGKYKNSMVLMPFRFNGARLITQSLLVRSQRWFFHLVFFLILWNIFERIQYLHKYTSYNT